MPIHIKNSVFTSLPLDSISVKFDNMWISPFNVYVNQNGFWERLYTPIECGAEMTGSTTLPMDATVTSGPTAYSCVTFTTIAASVPIHSGAPDRVVIEQDSQVVFDTYGQVYTFYNYGRGNIGIPVQSFAEETIRVYNPEANSYWLNTVHCPIDWDSTRYLSNFNRDFNYVAIQSAKCLDGAFYNTAAFGAAKPIYHVDPNETAPNVKADSCSVLTTMGHASSGTVTINFAATEPDVYVTARILDSAGRWHDYTAPTVSSHWSEYHQANINTYRLLAVDTVIAPGPFFILLFVTNISGSSADASVVGHVSENGITRVVVTDFAWRSIYFEDRSGQVESQIVAENRSGNIYATDSAAQTYVTNNSAPTMMDIFNTWPRISGNNYFADVGSATGEAADWTYDSVNDRFVMPTNSVAAQEILSPDSFSTFTFEATVTSNHGDDDGIGLVIAFRRINNVNHSLVAVRTQGGFSPGNGFGLVYIVGDTRHLISTAEVGAVSRAWSGKYSRIKVSRTGSSVTFACTDWNNDTTYAFTDTVQLVDNVAVEGGGTLVDLSIFAGAAQWGFFNWSQANSTYYDVNFPAFASSYVYSIESNTLWDGMSGTWEQYSVPAFEAYEPHVIYTNEDNDQFYVYEGAVLPKP